MRRIRRVPLPVGASSYLAKKQKAVTPENARAVWKSARSTKTMAMVFDTLVRMAGSRARCMFCSDSRGADIDHFRPLSRYVERAFDWENHLLACAACNRCKGERFDLDGAGRPLLLNPIDEDPWEFLYFDSKTGIVTARFDSSGVENGRGKHTCDQNVLPLNIEAVTEGRKRTARNLKRAVDHFLLRRHVPNAIEELLTAIRDNDDYGLAEWYFVREGIGEPPFSNFKASDGDAWSRATRIATERA